MNHVRSRYGTLRAADYAAIDVTLEERHQPQDDYLELASYRRILHAQLSGPRAADCCPTAEHVMCDGSTPARDNHPVVGGVPLS